MAEDRSAEVALAEETDYRLPRHVIPERYELTLTPDLAAFTFAGEESVALRVTEPVREILLNAVDLEIHEAYLTGASGARVAATVTLEEAAERARIVPAETIQPGAWTLHLRFSGILNDKLQGFYRSTYRDDEGHDQIIATTQFEATDARRAFPCWDEPDFKAVFAVTLVVDQDLTAVSNSAVAGETRLPNGKKAVSYADTIPMSTYLVAFIVGRLVATDPVDMDGTPLRVICVPGKLHLTGYALEVGAFAVRFFADYYGIPYPGDKLDLLALPDFAMGAMENLGAVTFRETLLLVDPATAARQELERVADVIAHEIAHMWFGDLVTMRWWNGLWLNEAFATFMEMLAVDAFKPEWQRWVSFGLSRQAAQETDALASTRPIEFPVRKPEDAEGMFDILTYEKGAAVLRVLEQYLGGSEFRRGIALYLDRHRLGNAETTDLWDALEEATGQPARRIMDSWIFQGGFPLVSVETIDGGRRLRLTQQRFRYLAGSAATEAGGAPPAFWQVPVMLRIGTPRGAETRKVLLNDVSMTLDLPEGTDWVLANESGHGFYRVRYAPDLLAKLTGSPRADLSGVERFNLVSDTWAALVGGLTPIRQFLDLATLFRDETERSVWVAILGGLGYLRSMVAPDRRPAVQAVVRDLVAPAVDRLGWERRAGEDELTSQLRGTLIGALGGGAGNDQATQARARELLTAYLADRSAVDRDIVPAVITIVAYAGGPAEYDLFLDNYRTAATPQDRQRFLYALAACQDQSLLRRTLDLCLTDDVRTQDAPYVILSVLHNLAGSELAWEFIKARWDEITGRFPDNTHVRMLQGIRELSTPELAADVEQFFATHPVKQAGKTLDQHLEWLRINLAFRRREAEALAELFSGGPQ